MSYRITLCVGDDLDDVVSCENIHVLYIFFVYQSGYCYYAVSLNNGGGGDMGFFSFRIFFSDNTRVRIFTYFCRAEFNIRLHDKNSESDYFFFLHQNQNIFSATLGFRIFKKKKKKKKHSSPWKLNGPSLSHTLSKILYFVILPVSPSELDSTFV